MRKVVIANGKSRKSDLQSRERTKSQIRKRSESPGSLKTAKFRKNGKSQKYSHTVTKQKEQRREIEESSESTPQKSLGWLPRILLSA